MNRRTLILIAAVVIVVGAIALLAVLRGRQAPPQHRRPCPKARS